MNEDSIKPDTKELLKKLKEGKLTAKEGFTVIPTKSCPTKNEEE